MDIISLLRKHRIRYRESGKNVSAGNIVISCPFCRRLFDPDPGEHMGVNITTGQYHCWRCKSKSNNIYYLLRALGLSDEANNLSLRPSIEDDDRVDSKGYTGLQWFDPAENNQQALDYLAERLFLYPIEICRQFQLRTTPQGVWAQRLIIPLTIGWTGRAMRQNLEPRYRAHTNESGFFLYKHDSTSVVVVEGALDAMRVASVSSQFDVIAKCRMTVSDAIMLCLKKYDSVYYAPDMTVHWVDNYREMKRIECNVPRAKVYKIQLPPGRKDFCDCTEHEARQILTHL